MQEFVPRTDRSIPHEDGYVQEHIDSRLKRVVQSLETEPVIPGEDIAGDEASQNIVAAYHATGADDEQRQRDRKNEKALPIHVLVFLGPMKKFLGNPTDDSAVDDTEDDSVAPGFAEPETHGKSCAAMLSHTPVPDILDKVQGKEQEGIAEAVVGARLGDDDVLKILRDIVVGKLTLDNDVGQHGIRWRNASTDGQGVENVQVWDQSPDDETRNQPHGGHDGT